jgi:class 3 adenylate cyclase
MGYLEPERSRRVIEQPSSVRTGRSGERRKLAAILAADVVGYSRVMEADEAATLSAPKERKKIREPLLSKHHGRVVNLMRDGRAGCGLNGFCFSSR